MNQLLAVTVAASAFLAACSEDRNITGPMTRTADIDARGAGAGGDGRGAVYTITNAAGGNAIVILDRARDGSLSYAATVPTGGLGAGSSLASQGAVALSENGRWLLAVNAGSDDISVFRVGENGLALASRVASGGSRPVSVTISGHTVYALNAGGAGNISGFRLDSKGRLIPIAGSTRGLSGDATAPAQVSFSGDGRWLAVTEKATNAIDVYPVGNHDVAGAGTSYPSAGATPYGFAFGKTNQIYVSEAGGTASSYRVGRRGGLSTVSGAVSTHQGAPCWLAITRNDRFAYTANAASGTISGFTVGHDGSLSLLDDGGVTAVVGGGNTDLAIDGRSRFLYQLRGAGTVSAFVIEKDGHLTPVGVTSGLPAGLAGLAAS